jgi:hypothetical protein
MRRAAPRGERSHTTENPRNVQHRAALPYRAGGCIRCSYPRWLLVNCGLGSKGPEQGLPPLELTSAAKNKDEPAAGRFPNAS